MRQPYVLVAAMVVCMLRTAAAATLLVLPDGTGDYATIQEAVNAAAAGDTLQLGAGTFIGAGNRNVSVYKDLTIRSQDGVAANCAIDCQGPGRGLLIVGTSAAMVVEGITIRNGNMFHGGGIHCSAASPTIRNCVLENNGASANLR